ncbi:uncharacterized protein BN736_01628 [Prevotella sp. CAG:617]|nr:uncharacterized protein BN736_01628 [Prevotella sp. CAG:617]
MKTENNASPLTFRRATTEDIPLVQRLAEATFPVTYAQILTPQQSDYMMDWMYSTDSLRRQMLEEGHVFFIGQDVRGEAVGYVSVQPESAELCHLQKLYAICRSFTCCPPARATAMAARFLSTPSTTPAAWAPNAWS